MKRIPAFSAASVGAALILGLGVLAPEVDPAWAGTFDTTFTEVSS